MNLLWRIEGAMIDENHNAVGFENGTQLPVAHRAHRRLQEASPHAESNSEFLQCKQAIEPGVSSRVPCFRDGMACICCSSDTQS